MKHVVISIQPFVMQQVVSAYIDGECVKYVKCGMDEVDKACKALCKEYDIHEVDIAGNKELCEKIYQSITSTDYDNFNIEVKFH